jgi:tetratricopeptide (TPR) repeat protein
MQDASFKSQNWKLSKQFYNNALSVDESQEYPKKQLEIIEQKINEQEALLAESKEKLEKFNSLISQGDNSLKTEDFDMSKSKYLEAKELFPKNSTVDQKLKHLNVLIDQKLKSNQLDSSFKELITQADKLRDNEKWEEAIDKYRMAAKIKTLDTYPKQQIDLINLKITEQTNSNIQSQYQDLIKSADELLLDSSYAQAIQKVRRSKRNISK